MTTIPDSHRDLIDGPYLATLTTIAPDGVPENTIVWSLSDGDTVLVATAAGRRKDKNVRANPHVALCVLDPRDGYRWIDVRGVVAEIAPDENYETINKLAKLYAGQDSFYGGVAPAEVEGTEERVVFRIRPHRVTTSP